jgi:predicted cupin superfamily sugar epimerase/alkylhydroperoxidase family enzyme
VAGLNAADAEIGGLVEALGLAPHPEGGFYRETYRSATGDTRARAASTAIYFLLPEGQVSRLHRIDADEAWHLYLGGPLDIHELDPDQPGEPARVTRLGANLRAGERPQHVVPAGRWFGASVAPGAGFALAGCTVAPGFEFSRFELADRAALLSAFPHARETVMRLTGSADPTADTGAKATSTAARDTDGNTAPPRIEPLSLDAADAGTRELLGRLTEIRGADTRLLNVFGTLAHHPALLRHWLGFATYLLRDSTLDARLRELVVLRVGWLCRSPYEWGQHVHVARGAGVSDADIARVASGAQAPGWSAAETAALRATEELIESDTVTDATWSSLANLFDTRQVLDLIFLVGQYRLVSGALNACRVERDDGLDSSSLPFPGDANHGG